MEIRILGAHQSQALEGKFVSILVDDILALDAGNLASALSIPAQANLKGIILTHHHYDHIKDVPFIGFNTMNMSTTMVYSTNEVKDVLVSHLGDGVIWPNLFERPSAENPTLAYTPIEPNVPIIINNYEVIPIPVHHGPETLGIYLSMNGKSLFYTSDTGPGLADVWQRIAPGLLIMELTYPDKLEAQAKHSGHLTPKLLNDELQSFHSTQGYLPPVVLVHINPNFEKEIQEEIDKVSAELGTSIQLGYEGMNINI